MAGSPSNASRAPLVVLTGVIALLLAGGAALWAQEGRRGRERPEYSVFRTDPRGAALVFRLFERSGLQPRVWDQDLTHLRRPGILFLIAPARPVTLGTQGPAVGQEGDLLPPEIKALDDWVRAGNVVVILSRQMNPLYRAVGLIVEEPKAPPTAPLEPSQPSLVADRVADLKTETRFGFAFGRKKDPTLERLKVSEPPEPVPVLPAAEWIDLFARVQNGRPVPQVVAGPRGSGLYVAVSDPFPASNVGLPQGDNARFLLNLARLRPAGGTVWFDEFHKRNVERGLVAYLRERSLGPALIYAVLLLGLLAWRAGSRFGETVPLVADPRRDSLEYVRAVGTLYRNARLGQDCLSTLQTDFYRRVLGHRATREDAEALAAEVGRRIQTRTGRSVDETTGLLREIDAALAHPKLEEARVVELAARLAQFDQALTQTRAARPALSRPQPAAPSQE